MDGCDGVAAGSVPAVAMAVSSRAILVAKGVVWACLTGCAGLLSTARRWSPLCGGCPCARVLDMAQAEFSARSVEAAGSLGSVWCGYGCDRLMWKYMRSLEWNRAGQDGHDTEGAGLCVRRRGAAAVPGCLPTMHEGGAGDRVSTAADGGASTQTLQWEARKRVYLPGRSTRREPSEG